MRVRGGVDSSGSQAGNDCTAKIIKLLFVCLFGRKVGRKHPG